jgi:hypothetical protein
MVDVRDDREVADVMPNAGHGTDNYTDRLQGFRN